MRLVLAALALIVVAGGVVLYSIYRSDIAAARALVEKRSNTIETSFGTIEYAEAGTGAPILVIHGAGGGFDQGLESAGALADSHRVIAPSRFGYLRSTFPDKATVAMQADALAALLDDLGLDRVGVLGISAGALSAIEFAIRHPERTRALVLLVPAAYSPTRKPPAGGNALIENAMLSLLGSDFMFWMGVRFLPDTMTAFFLATDPALVHAASKTDQDLANRLLRHILPVSLRVDGLVFDGASIVGATTPPALDKITAPVLAISAKDDRYQTADTATYVATHVANGRATIFDAGGHIGIGHEAEITEAIGSFIDAAN